MLWRQSPWHNRTQSPLLALQVALPREPVKPRAGFMLSAKALKEFKEIWERKYGETLSDEIAAEEAINMLVLFDAVYKPIRKEGLDEKKTL